MATRPKILILNPPLKLREVSHLLRKKAKLIRGYYREIEILFSTTDMQIFINGKDLRTFDYVWVTGSWSKRDLAHVISLYLTEHKVPHTLVKEGSGSSKLVDMAHYALGHLPQPKSYYCINSEYIRRAEEIAAVCQFPLIAKDVRGTFGRKSFLAENLSELKQKLFTVDEYTDFIFQEFIPNEYDWGIIVAKGKVSSAEKSYRNKMSNSFMNHAAGGAIEIFVQAAEVPNEVKAIAIEASNRLQLDWARSDIIVSSESGKPYILETNRSPRMTVKSTEVNAFADYIATFL